MLDSSYNAVLKYSVVILINQAMSEKELKQLKKDGVKLQKKVAKSPEAAKEFLIELGVFTAKGNLKKRFKVA